MAYKRNIAVFISSGIGNAILIVPILRLLKKNTKNRVVIILTSPFVNPEFLLYNNFPADEIIDLRNKNLILFGLKNINSFEKSYLDFSSSSIKNLLVSSLISKESYTYRKKNFFIPGIKFIIPQNNTHSAVLHAKIVDSKITKKDFSLDLMRLDIVNKSIKYVYKIVKQKQKIISIQLSSGNNKTPFKNWPLDYWIIFLKKIIVYYPEYKIILLGDTNEVDLGLKVKDEIKNDNIINLIGKTDLNDASAVLFNSDLYIGLDSAFMHLAAAYDIPTFTILGASSEKLIGYEQFDSKKHCTVFNDLPCRSCHSWYSPNTTKVKNPLKCPDMECLTGLNPDKVFEKFKIFFYDKSYK